jgi:cytochrome c peroxidase
VKLLLTSTILLTSLLPTSDEPVEENRGSRLPRAAADTDFYDAGAPDPALVELGRLLFFDKLLGGNQNISCATCHHPDHATSDGLALPLGEGPRGLGPERRPGSDVTQAVYERVPRNSPALWNLGAKEFTRMFHDGRVETDPDGFFEGGFVTPAKWKLPQGLDNVLAAQAMFPVTSPTEMAGQQGENELANAKSANKAAGPEGVWELAARRLRANPEYVDLFRAAFPDEVRSADDVNYVRAANAIAAFEAEAFRADDSPFDRFLRGESQLSAPAARGKELFYGAANCGSCHSGTFQTDHDFHAIAMPQIGPGKSDGWDASYWRATGQKAFTEDFGRGRVTARTADRYRFRTPSLRNVELTGPWGHAGSYATLEGVVRHHLDPVASLNAYEPPADLLPALPAALELTAKNSRLEQSWMSDKRLDGFRQRDAWVQTHPELRDNIAQASELEPTALTDAEVDDLVAFLRCLTDERSRDLGHLVPERVPSGLPVAD